MLTTFDIDEQSESQAMIGLGASIAAGLSDPAMQEILASGLTDKSERVKSAAAEGSARVARAGLTSRHLDEAIVDALKQSTEELENAREAAAGLEASGREAPGATVHRPTSEDAGEIGEEQHDDTPRTTPDPNARDEFAIPEELRHVVKGESADTPHGRFSPRFASIRWRRRLHQT